MSNENIISTIEALLAEKPEGYFYLVDSVLCDMEKPREPAELERLFRLFDDSDEDNLDQLMWAR